MFLQVKNINKGKPQLVVTFKASSSSEIMTEAYNICSKKNVSEVDGEKLDVSHRETC